jgi:acyl-CoA thioester hydrolase
MPRSDFDFAYQSRVRYADIDMQGVMFNAVYLAYFDTAITEFFRSRQFDFAQRARESGIDFHVVRALVEYKQPVPYDTSIEVCVRIERIGSSSITFLLEIHPTGEDRLMTTGEIVYVHTDQKTHRPVRVPEEVRRILLGPAIQLPSS